VKTSSEVVREATPSGAIRTCIIATSPGWAIDDLHSALRGSNGLGHPDDWFRPESVTRRARGLDVAPGSDFLARYLEAVRSAAGVGIVTVTVQWLDFSWLLHGLRTLHDGSLSSDGDLVARNLPDPHYVHVTVSDPVGQALAWWDELHQHQPGRPVPGPPDFREVRLLEGLIETHERRWVGFFRRHQILPLRLTTGDLSADPARTVARVAAVMGVRLDQGDERRPARRPDIDRVRSGDDIGRDLSVWRQAYLDVRDGLPSRITTSEPWLEGP
jgi:LPS sulfotransferase NodH